MFNVDQLKRPPGTADNLVGRPLHKTTKILYDENGERVWVIERLEASHSVNKRRRFLVQWADLPTS